MTRTGRFDRFFSLISNIQCRDKRELKEQLVWQYSNLRTTSLKDFFEMDKAGYYAMCDAISRELIATKQANKATLAMETKRLRSSILLRLQRYGIDTTSWVHVNKFLEQPRICGKRLYELSIEEMQNLIPKLESILDKQRDKKENERNLSTLN
jgi:hypothetical protein